MHFSASMVVYLHILVGFPVTFSPSKKWRPTNYFVLLLWYCSPSLLKILAIETFWRKIWNRLTSQFLTMSLMKNGIEIPFEYPRRYAALKALVYIYTEMVRVFTHYLLFGRCVSLGYMLGLIKFLMPQLLSRRFWLVSLVLIIRYAWCPSWLIILYF